MIQYPEILDISNIDDWKKKFVRRELMTGEWDLISLEIAPDIFEVPVFTEEFCDKFVDNLKSQKSGLITIWGHNCEEVEYPNEIQAAISNLFTYHILPCYDHQWRIDFKSYKNLSLENSIVRLKKNQDLRVRHDSCLITNYIKLDSDSTGGELYFPKYNFILKPKQGHGYFFPGSLTHRYGIKVVKSQINNSLFTYVKN